MATQPVTAKLRLRLELIVALPEPIMLDRRVDRVPALVRHPGVSFQGPLQDPAAHAPRHQCGESRETAPAGCEVGRGAGLF